MDSIEEAIMRQFDLSENIAYNYAKKIAVERIIDDFIDIYNRMTDEERADDDFVIDEIMSYYTGDVEFAMEIYMQLLKQYKG